MERDFFYLNQTAHWLAWSPAAHTTFYRLIQSDYFWLIVSVNLLPLLFILCTTNTAHTGFKNMDRYCRLFISNSGFLLAKLSYNHAFDYVI